MHVRLAHLEHGEVGGLFAGQPVQGQGGQLTQVALTTVWLVHTSQRLCRIRQLEGYKYEIRQSAMNQHEFRQPGVHQHEIRQSGVHQHEISQSNTLLRARAQSAFNRMRKRSVKVKSNKIVKNTRPMCKTTGFIIIFFK